MAIKWDVHFLLQMLDGSVSLHVKLLKESTHVVRLRRYLPSCLGILHTYGPNLRNSRLTKRPFPGLFLPSNIQKKIPKILDARDLYVRSVTVDGIDAEFSITPWHTFRASKLSIALPEEKTAEGTET